MGQHLLETVTSETVSGFGKRNTGGGSGSSGSSGSATTTIAGGASSGKGGGGGGGTYALKVASVFGTVRISVGLFDGSHLEGHETSRRLFFFRRGLFNGSHQ